MKYFWVALGCAAFFGIFGALHGEKLGSSGAIIGDNFAYGLGTGFAAVIIGCIGIFTTKNRFKGFVIGTGVGSIALIYLAVTGQL